MAGVAYTLDGHLVKPRVVTIFQLWAKTTGGGSCRIEATSDAERWAQYYDGRRQGLFVAVIGTGERQGEDPAEAAAYRAELRRIVWSSCHLSDDYLAMRLFVKALPAERCNEINPYWLRGYPHLSCWLREQYGSKLNECKARGIAPAPSSDLPWWKRSYPWRTPTP